MISVNQEMAEVQAGHYRRPMPVMVMNCPGHGQSAATADGALARLGLSPATPVLICQGMFSLHRGDGPGLENLVSAVPEEYGCGMDCDMSSSLSIASAINSILADRDVAVRMRAGALRAAQVYSWEQREQNLLQLCRQLAGAPAKGA